MTGRRYTLVVGSEDDSRGEAMERLEEDLMRGGAVTRQRGIPVYASEMANAPDRWSLGYRAGRRVPAHQIVHLAIWYVFCYSRTSQIRNRPNFLIEHFVAWRGKRGRLRKRLQATSHYADWVDAAKEMDTFLGNDKWKVEDQYAYYDHKTVKRVLGQIRRCRKKVEEEQKSQPAPKSTEVVEELKGLVEACVKNNFVGVENARLYGQTYYGTKNLVQQFIDEGKVIRMWADVRN